MGLELIKFINPDLAWSPIFKGHRNTKRRPRRPGARSSEIDRGLGNKVQDSFVYDYEKSGVAVLGQHFAGEVLDVPIKKRILLLQSPSLSGEGTRSPQPQTSSPNHQESELLVGSKHASGQHCHPNSPSNIWAMKSKNGSSNSEHLKPTDKEVSDLNDFSGIELLAAAACCSSVYDSSGHMESFATEEPTTPRVDVDTDAIKKNVAPMDSDDSSVQDSTFPATENICGNENGGSDKRVVPSKGVRLHWDLNTVMDEWEEPCDIPVDPHTEKGYLKDASDDSLQNAKVNLEGSETGMSHITGVGNRPGKHDASVPVVPFCKPEISGLQENNDGDSFGKTYIATSGEVVEAITCKTSDAESCLSKSDVVDSFVHPAKCENVSTSSASVSLGETTIKVESNIVHDFPMYFEPSSKSDDRQAVSEVVQGGCLSLKGDGDDKLTSEDRLSDCCVSNVSQDERDHMAEGNTVEKVKAGYDSPVEDGELREPIRYENEVEERECVDYESDNIYEDSFETIESDKNEVSIEHHQTIGDGRCAVPNNDNEQDDKADASKRTNHLLGFKASEYQRHEHSQCAIVEEKDGSCVKFLSRRKNSHDEFPGANMLFIDRSTSSGMRRSGVCIQRSRSDNIGDSFSRAQRDFDPEKFMERDYLGHARNDPSGQWGDSSVGGWDSRSSHGYPRPKNVNGGSAVRSGDQAINYNPRGVYKTFNARPSPSDRNESYGIRRGTPPSRGTSHDRYRGGSGFHLQGLRRAPQEEYHDPPPSYSERKVRHFSPNFNRGAHVSRSRRRSRSRSRSGSPIAWHFQKKRNVDSKRQSPDYRPDARFQGERFPLRKLSSSNEIVPRLVSPTRGHMSPQHISRSFEDRNTINGQFRDKRSSPVSTAHRNQRFEAGGYLGRLKSNDNFRPTPRPGRFQQLGPNREKFDSKGNNSMIHEDKYGMSGGRRCRYDVDESFKTRNPRNNDNGFRYARNENRCFKDPIERDTASLLPGEGDFRKDGLQRER